VLTNIVLFYLLLAAVIGVPLMMNVWGKANDIAAAARMQLNSPSQTRVVYVMVPSPPASLPAVPADPKIDLNPPDWA